MNHAKRNIIITGAGSGIGAAAARVFSESGDLVHLFDVSEKRLDQVASELKTVKTYLVDVTDALRVREVVESIEKDFGSVDVLVSNAGIFDGLASIEQTSYELWKKVIETNLTGAFNIIKPASEVMVRQGSGRIITISSIAATRVSPDGLSYVASKAGLEGMTRRLAIDLGKYGITANTVAPGVIETDILSTSSEILGTLLSERPSNDNSESNLEFIETVIPSRRTGQPVEVAATIHFLASDGAAYINGEVIHVDGGWIAS